MLSPDQLERISQISNPLIRQRFGVFYQLPADLQESMLAEDTAGSIWRITKEKYNLTDRNVSAVARIIGLIFLGEMPIKNFIVELKNALGVDVQKAQQIAQDINQAIFQPVRESLMKVHGIEQYANQTPNVKAQMPNQVQNPNVKTLRPQTNNGYDTQRRRDEVLSKIRPPQPPVARPASYVKLRNTVDLRRIKRKNNRYNGFFT